MKTLILYYSYGGNTKKIAEMIRKQCGGDIAEIETVAPYVGSYNDVVEQGRHEVNNGVMPPIKPINADIADYDTVILGTPVWWYTFAPAINTFLHENDLTGKRIYPFATNGGWIGHTFKDISNACPNATVSKGIDIRFNEHTLKTPEKEIINWADGIGD